MTQTEASGEPAGRVPTSVPETAVAEHGDLPGIPATEVELPAGKAANETLEDYTLRFAPRSYRRWGTGVVATSALGGIAYLADL
jgi:hypothetical protein